MDYTSLIQYILVRSGHRSHLCLDGSEHYICSWNDESCKLEYGRILHDGRLYPVFADYDVDRPFALVFGDSNCVCNNFRAGCGDTAVYAASDVCGRI